MSRQPLLVREHRDLTVCSLLRYKGEAKKLIHACKRGRSPFLSKKLSNLLIQNYSEQSDLLTGFLGVIPIPPRKSEDRDHAHLIAEEISRVLDLPLVTNVLAYMENGETQKSKKLAARTDCKFSKIESDNEFANDEGVWILVDDVITTGSTLKEARNVLGLKATLALTLASRPFVLR